MECVAARRQTNADLKSARNNGVDGLHGGYGPAPVRYGHVGQSADREALVVDRANVNYLRGTWSSVSGRFQHRDMSCNAGGHSIPVRNDGGHGVLRALNLQVALIGAGIERGTREAE